MATCPSCGNESQGRFCAHCGGSMGTAGAETNIPPPPIGGATAAGLPENQANAICYLLWFVTGILFLVMEPYSRNPRTRFHAFQSIFTSVAFIAYWMVCGALAFLMPTVIWLMIAAVNMLVWLAMFFFWLFLMWKAYKGETFVVPIVGPLAQQQASATR